MAIALVGSVGAAVTGVNPAPSFGQATTAGDLLIAWVVASFAITVDQGWTLVNNNGGDNPSLQIGYKANCGAGETAPIFTTTPNSATAKLAEFSGADTVSPLDQSGRDISTNAGTSPFVFNLSSADAASGDLIVAVGAENESKAGTATLTHTFNNGATDLLNSGNGATSSFSHFHFGYGITTGNASADQDSFASDSMNLSALKIGMATFKVASAAVAATLKPTGSAFQDPAVFMGGIKRAWHRRRSGIFVPEYAI